MSDHLPAYVAGTWKKTNQTAQVHAPFDGREIATVSLCGKDEIEASLAAAQASLEKTKRLSSYERAAICRDVSARLAARKEEIALGMCDEGGKPIGDARAEVDRAVHCFEIAAAEAERMNGEMIPLDLRPASAGRFGITKHVPVGVVAAISPFNFPLNLAVHKVAPAIAAGCPVVLKPAPQTPLSVLRMAECIDQTAWPKGALSVVPSTPAFADALVTDERVKLLTFTGSPKVGWELKRRAGKKKVVLELGSNAAVIVDDDADLNYAVPKINYGAFSYAGQKCISVQRIYAHKKIYAQLKEKLIDAANKAKVGDPRDPDVLVGPLVNEAAAARVMQWIDEAKARGATVLCGGTREKNVVKATYLEGVPRDAKVSCEEVFGPVAILEPFDDVKDALHAVNDSAFGLQAGIFTEKIDHAIAAWDDLDVGGVIVNDTPTYRIDHMPYGGVKESGLGREGIKYAMADMTEVRILVVNRAHHA